MKFLRFFIKPHRLIAILLGLGFLTFTQFVVFKPVQVMPVSNKTSSVMTINQTSQKRDGENVDSDEDFSVEDLYYGDLIEALENMSGDDYEFSGLSDLDVQLSNQKKNTVKKADGIPKIAIVIDDLGMNRTQSWNVVNLDFPLTLAFLPYAKNIQEMADQGKEKGHDVILHVPMQPLDHTVNAGENVLEVGKSEVLLKQVLDKNLSALSGYVGINNHMGSAFTQDEKGMNFVMAYLKERGLFYLDSRTIAESVASEVAERHDLPFLERDVFLDHEETVEYAEAALKDLERIAREQGQAIAIGHPKEITISVLNSWFKNAQNRGIKFVTLSELIEN